MTINTKNNHRSRNPAPLSGFVFILNSLVSTFYPILQGSPIPSTLSVCAQHFTMGMCDEILMLDFPSVRAKQTKYIQLVP